jgi:hypothetical protein
LKNESTKQFAALHDEITNAMQSLQLQPARMSNGASKCRDTNAERLAKLSKSLAKLQTLTSLISRENIILQCLSFPSIYDREDSIHDAENGTFSWMVERQSPVDGGDDHDSDDDWETVTKVLLCTSEDVSNLIFS